MIKKGEFTQARETLTAYVNETTKSESVDTLMHQVQQLEKIQQQLANFEITSAQIELTKLNQETNQEPTVAEQFNQLDQEVTKQVTMLQNNQALLDQKTAQTVEALTTRNGELEPLTKLATKGDMKMIVEQANAQINQNKETIASLEAKEKAAAALAAEKQAAAKKQAESAQQKLTQEAAFAIAKARLPEYFDPDKTWVFNAALSTADTYDYSGINDGSFRAVLTLHQDGDQLHAKLSVGMREQTVTTYTWPIEN